jgi:hypothetical protein
MTMNNADSAGPAAPTQPAGPGLPACRSRTGKIARLPLAIRQELNERLRDGQPGNQLVVWLNSLPEVRAVMAAQFQGQPIGEVNLSRWRKGGFLSWEQDQKTREAAAALIENASSLQEAGKNGLTERLSLVLAAKMAGEVNRLDSIPDGAEKSKIWHDLLGHLDALRRGESLGERLRLEWVKVSLRQWKNARRVFAN